MIETGLDLAAVESSTAGADPRAVLIAAQHLDDLRRRAQIGVMITALAWADAHPATEPWEAAGIAGVPLNAETVPTLTMTAVAELAAMLRCSTIAGAHLIGDALELRHRLPRTWGLLRAGTIEPHRARQVAGLTRWLADDTATEVDRQFAAVGGLIGPARTERLVDAAIARHEPDRAAELARRAREARGVWFEPDEVPGLTTMTGRLDHGDAEVLDQVLEVAARDLAGQLVETPHQSLRAMALGDLGRGQAPLPVDEAEIDTAASGELPRPRPRPTRRYTVHVHLSDHALGSDGDAHPWGRVDGIDAPVPAELIRDWLADPTARITIRPVVDLSERHRVDSYEIPNRLRERIILTEPRCVFPWCDKPSTASRIDIDHIVAHADGGPTSTDNLAPLCRTHHRLKTHAGWRYTRTPDGSYHWRSPHGYTIIRDHQGTYVVEPAAEPFMIIGPDVGSEPPRVRRRPPPGALRRLRRWINRDVPVRSPRPGEPPPF